MRLFHKPEKDLIKSWLDSKQPMLLHYTGSMFGIGCDARDIEAIKSLNYLKNRDSDNSYIVLIHSIEAVKNYSVNIAPALYGLLSQYSPGPLTVVLPCNDDKLAHLARNGKVAFRIPENADLRQFLENTNTPLISTSINLKGEKPEIDFRHIMNNYKTWFDFALLPENELIAEAEPSTIVTLESDKITCIREGKINFSQLENDYYHPLVNFLCTGNICRSPMAEYYFRQQAEIRNFSWHSTSSGLLESGIPISKNSLILLKNDKIDASEHLSKQINLNLVKRSRLVLTMTEKHKKTLQNADWDSGNIFTLGEYVGHNLDVQDPYQQSIDVYETAYNQIKFYIDLLISKLEKEYAS